MADLVVMMGVPGSGKSTYAKKMLGENDIYLSRDIIRYALVKEDEEYFSKENEVLQTFIKAVDKALTRAKRYVIADATHLNRGSRDKLLRNLQNQPDHVYVVYIDVPLEVALERNKERTGRALVPESAIRNMYKSLSLPTKNEKIDAVYKVNQDGYIYDTIIY